MKRTYPLINGDTGFDFSEFSDFAKEFKIKSKNFKMWLRRWCDKKAKEVLSQAVARTPWDTGYLATHWESPKIHITGNEVAIYFENTAYYASWVEYGHAKPYKGIGTPGTPDWVDGRFMLTVPLNDFVNDMPAEFEQAFWQYLESKAVY